MYQKYQTDSLILGSRESGEADRLYTLFTKDFGLVRARATSVRSEKSKMRYALQNYSRANVSLVKGRRGWRLAGATPIAGAHGDLQSVAAFGRISELVMRLVHGEEVNPYLFSALAEGHAALMREDCEAFGMIEIVCVARVLYALGYISAEALETALFTHTAYTGESLIEAETMRDKLLSSINKAMTETHL